jgi:hypothetical protein
MDGLISAEQLTIVDRVCRQTTQETRIAGLRADCLRDVNATATKAGGLRRGRARRLGRGRATDGVCGVLRYTRALLRSGRGQGGRQASGR